ncbi:hypothetical protein N9S98_01620 [Alphaproteobacteria bacterium]|nr:hypothetical protein [Alphaproteobacteria bacterium]
MNYFRINNIEALQDFPNQSSQLAIMNRSMPKNSTSFFEKLVEISFNIIGEVNKDTAFKDVKNLLSDKIPKEIKNDFFYEIWVKDMANLCEMFCITEKSSYISFL